MDFTKLVDWIKLSPRHSLAVAIASGVLLFLGDGPLATLGLEQLRAKYRPWIGGIFLLSSVLLLSYPLAALGKRVSTWWRDSQFVRGGRQRLRQLTPWEKEILRRFVERETRTQTLNFKDGVVAGLVDDSIIYQSSNLGTIHGNFAYNIQPWAWKELRKHPELLS